MEQAILKSRLGGKRANKRGTTIKINGELTTKGVQVSNSESGYNMMENRDEVNS